MQGKARLHKDLVVWQESMALAEVVYRRTSEFPSVDRFGLVAQMRRSAISVPSNIAEGAGRGSSKEFAQFLRIARGSLAELETQIELASRLGLGIQMEQMRSHCALCGRMLTNLTAAINQRIIRPKSSPRSSNRS